MSLLRELILFSFEVNLFLMALSGQRCCDGNETDIKTINILLMLPFPDLDPLGREAITSLFDNGHGIAPAAYLAVEQINNQTDILKGYKLELIRSDGGCDVMGRTTENFANYIYSRTVPIAGIIGPLCRDSSESVAKLTTNEKAALISLPFFKTPNLFKYRNAFGIIEENYYLDDLYFELMVENNWKRVAILYSNNGKDFDRLQERINNSTEHELVLSLELSFDLIPLEAIRDSFVNVVFANVFEPTLHSRLFCLAYHLNMTYPDYQWIFESYPDEAFENSNVDYNGKTYHCSTEEIHTAIKGSLYFFVVPDIDFGMDTISGINISHLANLYYAQAKVYTNRYNVSSVPFPIGLLLNDATWALALALNSSLNELEERNITFSERDLPRQRDITEIIAKNLKEVQFKGIFGTIKFDNAIHYPQNERFNLFQYSSNSLAKTIGRYEFGKLQFNTTFRDYNLQFKYVCLSLSIAVPYLLLTVIALLLTVLTHIINVVYRNHKSIKASSHKLNHIIFLGCYLVILAIVLHTAGETLTLSLKTHTNLCNLFPVFSNLGLTLILATVCVKTWRLYNIFTSQESLQRSKKFLKDPVMALKIGCFFFIEIAVNIIWMATAPLKAKYSTTFVESIDDSVPTVFTDIICYSNWTFPCLTALTIYKGFILFLSLLFAILSRNIHLKEFKTKNIIILVYLLSILFAIGVPLYLIMVLESVGASAQFLVLISILVLTVYICLAVLFLPPLRSIIGEKYRTVNAIFTSIQSRVTEKTT